MTSLQTLALALAVYVINIPVAFWLAAQGKHNAAVLIVILGTIIIVRLAFYKPIDRR